jgi:PleD family two-component response regulator
MPDNWILLIDPFKDIVSAYRMVLEQEKYLVETSRNLDEAFHLFSMRQHSVIITEYLPPFEDTYRMIQRVKQNSPGTYIIMITQEIIDAIKYEKFFAIGLDDLILKPFSPEKILIHIRKGLRQRELILKKQRLEECAFLDPITQKIQNFVFNSIYFKKCFRQEVKKAKRYQRPLSLLLIQIPDMERIEERFENFCIELVQIVRKYTREEDMVGRHNGAFGVILPETGQVGSQALVQRLLNLIQNHPTFQSDDVLRPFVQTLSFQTFTYPDNFLIPESLKSVVEEINKESPRH